MANFLSILFSLGFKTENLAIFIVILFGLAGFFFLTYVSYLKVGHKFEILNKDIGHIKETLSNHITDTNKKIDKLDSKFDKIMAHLLKK